MKIVVLSGTPGCGKTTVSHEISKKAKVKVISINELAIEKKFTEKYDQKRDTYVIDFERFIPYLVKTIQTQSEKGLELLLVEGHFSDIVPDELIDVAIILRCHPDVLYERLKARNYKKEKIIENVQAEILANCLNYFLEKNLKEPLLEIDTTEISIENLSDLIIDLVKGMKSKEEFKIGKIDWLEMLFQEDRMQEYFD